MKTLRNIIVLSTLILSFTFCKKSHKDPDAGDSSQITPTGTYMLHLHSMLDTNEVENYNKVYITSEGRKISLTACQLYLSELELVKADGTVFPFTGKKILKVLETEIYMIGSAPVGNYRALRFKVGLNPDKQNPVSTADSSILNRPEMWFTTNPQQDGYVFLNVSGKLDTTYNSSATEAQMQTFNYKIGTSANYKQVIMPEKNFTILADQMEYAHILIDYKQLFTGVKLNDPTNLSVSTVNSNSTSQAAKIVSNIPLMFKYE